MASPGVQSKRSKASFLRYFDGIFVVTKREIHRVFLWLYQGGSQYVGDYLKTLPGVIRRLGSMAKKALLERRDSPATFDIPMLYLLCQYTCGLTDHDDPIWNNPTSHEERGSLEHSLYLLKDKRNKLCHEPWTLMQMTADDLDNNFDELKRLCEVILRESGQKAGRPTSEVNGCVIKMHKDFDDIKTKPVSSGMTEGIFGLKARIEMRKNHTPSPVDGNFIFPSLQSKGEDGSYERNLQDFLLWQCGSGSNPKTIVLSGGTGTGKTTICRHIYHSWISNNTDICHLDDFDLVIPVQCCSVSTCDVIDFLRGFMVDTHSLCGRDEILTFLKSLRILWVFDGFEEATKVAIELLKEIVQDQGNSSLVFITTQPQRLQDLTNDIINSKDTTCEVALLGISEENVEDFLRMELSEQETGNFRRDINELGRDLLEELKVPLRLKQLVEVWKGGKLNKESGASVYISYRTLMKINSKKIIDYLKKETKLKERDIEKRVLSWENGLCKIAFQMIMNNDIVKINRNYQDTLEHEAERLIYPEYCISTYLEVEPEKNSNSCFFRHGTQQIYLASQYASNMVQKDGILPEELNRLPKEKTSFRNRQSDYILHSMLLQVVSSVAEQKNVKDNIAKELVQLLSTFKNNFSAFKVIRHASYDSVFTEEVSKYSGLTWKILDHDVKAAVNILQYATPTLIKIYIEKDPNEAQELSSLLQLIARRDVELKLSLFFHLSLTESSDTSDNFLRDTCSTDVKCHLISFKGCLSTDSIENLTKMREIRKLHLKVISNEVLQEILINLKFLKNLESLVLSFMMPVVTVPSSHSFDLRIDKLIMFLPIMDESKVNETADAISNISKHYNQIRLTYLSSSSAVQFIQRLQERKVRVNAIVREFPCYPFEVSGYFLLNFGCVPLTQSIDMFRHQWQNASFKIDEDDMGRKGLFFSNGGIPNSSIRYVDTKSLANIKQIKFA